MIAVIKNKGTKHALFMGVALVALMAASRPAAADCGTLNGANNTISGTETSACAPGLNENLTITSSGVINVVDENAVNIYQDAGEIVNNGLISTRTGTGNYDDYYYGIYVDNSAVDSIYNNSGGVIRNYMSFIDPTESYVDLAAKGIYLEGSDAIAAGGIHNEGLIDIKLRGEALQAYLDVDGIEVDEAAASVYNKGRILVDLTAIGTDNAGGAAEVYAHAINVDSSETIDEVVNEGLLSVTARAKNQNYFDVFTRVMRVDSVLVTGSVTNSGTIYARVTGEGNEGEVAARGINVRGGAVINGDVVNTGTIDLAGTSSSQDIGDESHVAGIYIDVATIDGDIINEGSISARLDAPGSTAHTYGIEIYDSEVYGALINRGTIHAQSTGLADATYGIRVHDSFIDDGIVNYGTISAGSGVAIYLENLTAPTNIYIEGGQIIGDIIDVNPDNGNSTVFVNADARTQGTYVVSDLIVDNGRTFTISAGDTMDLSDMSQSVGGTFAFGLSTPSNVGVLSVGNGNGLDFTGATITAHVEGGGAFTVGDEFLIARGDSSIVGLASGSWISVDDNSYLLDFEIGDGTIATANTGDTDLYMTVIQANTLASAASSTKNQKVAEVIDDLLPSGDADFSRFVDNLYAASSEEEINALLETVAPSSDTSNQVAAVGTMGEMFDLADGQLAMVNTGETGVSSGNHLSGLHVWAQGFGGAADHGQRSGVAGYDMDVYGLAVGADTRRLQEDTTIGVSFGYANTDVKSKDVNRTKNDMDSYQLMLYANRALKNDAFVTGMAAGSYIRNDQRRHDVGGVAGLDANADYGSWLGGLRGAVGRNYHTGGDLKLTPQLFSEFFHFRRNGYSETGAGGLNRTVDDSNQNVLNLGTSLQVEKTLKAANGLVFKPDVHVSYKYDLLNDKMDTTSSFAAGGPAFSTGGVDPARSTLGAGVGLKIYDTNGWDFAASYDYTYKSDYDAHSGFVRAAYQF